MQQQTFLNRKARKALLSGVLMAAFFLFAGVSKIMAQNWLPASEASIKANQEALSLKNGLAGLPLGTLQYEQQVRKMTMYNHIVANLRTDPNVGLAIELAVASAYSATFSTPANMQPAKGERVAGKQAATTLLSN